jgi:hypothetical protein
LTIEYRPHVTLLFVSTATVSLVYALRVLADSIAPLQRRAALISLLALSTLTILGAQADVLRGIVTNRADQLTYIRQSLMSKDPRSVDSVLVVLPGDDGCATEPCDQWFGGVTGCADQFTYQGGYKYALSTLGVSPDKMSFSFEKRLPSDIPAEVVVVDWRKYEDARLIGDE